MFKILVPVNGSECSLEAVDEAIRTAKERGEATIHLLNVQPSFHRYISRFAPAPQCDALRAERANKALEAAQRRVRAAGFPCNTHWVRGDIIQCVVTFAHNNAMDQIVVATSPSRGLARRFRQPIADRLVKASGVPVDVVSVGPVSPLERFGVPAGLGLGFTMVWLAGE